MGTEFTEFRDILATIAELEPEMDYTPVHSDEGFITLDEFACHYIHHQNDRFATLRLYMLRGEETITSKCDSPSAVYHWNGRVWTCPDFVGHPDLSSEDLARSCVRSLLELAGQHN